MSDKIKTVLLLGLKDRSSAPILNALRSNPDFDVSVAVQPGESCTIPDHESTKRVTPHTIDYRSQASVWTAFNGQDAIVSTFPPLDEQSQRNIIDTAIKTGVRRYIPSEYDIDTTLPGVQRCIPGAGNKRWIVKQLRQLQMEGKLDRLTWTAIIAGAYHTGFFGYDFTRHEAQIYGNENVPFEMTSMQRVGEAVVKCLQKLGETANQPVYVHSFCVTQRRVYDAISSASRSRAWRKRYVKLSEVTFRHTRDDSTANWNMGVQTKSGAEFMGDAFRWRGFNDFGERTDEWNDKLGLEDENLDAVCQKIVANEEREEALRNGSVKDVGVQVNIINA